MVIGRPRTPAAAAMLAYPCGKCGARPGEWCRSRGGYRTSTLHAWRYRIAKQRGDLPAPDLDRMT